MTERSLSCTLSHVLVRLTATLNLLHFGAAEFSHQYFQAVGHGWRGELAVKWALVSSLLLPVVVAIEAFTPRANHGRRAVWIDAAFVLLWLLVFLMP